MREKKQPQKKYVYCSRGKKRKTLVKKIRGLRFGTILKKGARIYLPTRRLQSLDHTRDGLLVFKSFKKGKKSYPRYLCVPMFDEEIRIRINSRKTLGLLTGLDGVGTLKTWIK